MCFIAGIGLLLAAGCRAPSGSASLTGTVVLGGVTDASGIAVTLAGPTPSATATDASGRYRFDHLAAGTYAVSVVARSTKEHVLTTRVTIAAGATVSAKPVDLTPVGVLTGTVAARGGGSAPEGTLVAIRGTPLSASTDATGRFTLSGVPVGTWSVVASSTGAGSASSSSVTVEWGKTTQVPPLVLGVSGTGTITGSATVHGEPTVSGLHVGLSGPVSGSVTTSSSGTFTFTGLPAGIYTVTANAPSTVERTQSVTVTVPSAGAVAATPFAFTPVGNVEGTITLAGASAGNSGIAVLVTGASREAFALTDDLGHFSVTDAPVGDVELQAARAGYGAASTASLAVAYATTTTAPDLVLEPAGTGSAALGTVRGLASPVGLADPSGITVTLTGDTGALPPATTVADGSYAIPDVPPGVYTATFERGPYQETISRLLSMPGTDGFVVGDGILPLAPLTLPRAPRLITVHDGIIKVLLTPDGSRAVILAGPSGSSGSENEIIGIDLATGVASVLTDHADPGPVLITPDGSRVVYFSGAGGSGFGTLTEMPIGGGAETRLLGDVYEQDVAVTPDSQTAVVLGHMADGSFEIVAVPLSGGTARIVAGEIFYGSPFILSADGTRLVVRTMSGLAAVSLDTGATTPLQGYQSYRGWFSMPSPDGTSVILTGHVSLTTTSPYPDLLSIPLDGGSPTVLASAVMERYVLATPDHTRLVLISNLNGQWGDLESVPTTGGSAVLLASPVYPYEFWITPAGDHVIYESPTGPLTSLPIDGGPATVLSATLASVAAFSADGTSVAWYAWTSSSPAVGDLHVGPVDGGPSTFIETDVDYQAGAALSADGSDVFYFRRESWSLPGATLVGAPVAGGPAAVILTEATGLWPVGGLVLSHRVGSLPPYQFQDGLYALSLP